MVNPIVIENKVAQRNERLVIVREHTTQRKRYNAWLFAMMQIIPEADKEYEELTREERL